MDYLGEYIAVDWENEPSQRTPVNAYNLGIMEDGIQRLFAYLIAGGGSSDGREVEFRSNGEYIQWRYSGEKDWTNLVALVDLKGDKGDNYILTEEDIEEIASKVKVPTSADKITYDDTETKLGATNVQEAIGKVSEQIGNIFVGATQPTNGIEYWLDTSEDGDENTGGGDSGGEDTPVVPDTYYTVTNNLTNTTTSNSLTSVKEGASYVATFTPDEGYELYSCTVTMGGVDISTSAYANGTVRIDEVTGDIVITVKSNEIESSAANLLDSPLRFIDNAYISYYAEQLRYNAKDTSDLYIVAVESGTYRLTAKGLNQYGNPYVGEKTISQFGNLSANGQTTANNPTMLLGVSTGDYNALTTSYGTKFDTHEFVSTGTVVTEKQEDGTYNKYVDITYDMSGWTTLSLSNNVATGWTFTKVV